MSRLTPKAFGATIYASLLFVIFFRLAERNEIQVMPLERPRRVSRHEL